jgi:thiamine biosynthesis protein ThiI
MNAALFLARISGEVATKSRRTRSRFQRRLQQNLADALRGTGARISDLWGRIAIEAPGGSSALPALSRVFGLASVSEVEGTCEPALERLVETGDRLYGERVGSRRFAVRARVPRGLPFDSRTVNCELGTALVRRGGHVHLDAPEIVVRVEVDGARACFYTERVAGPSWLPLGTEGQAVALLSGGYDSAVAAWMMLRRGLELEYVFCNLGGEGYERSVLRVAKLLADGWSYGYRPRLHVVDMEELVREIRWHARESFQQVVLKRVMYRLAERVARELDAQAIVTGEAVGQVSSQTAANLRAIDGCTGFPVFRPLIGFNKEEIIARSREIGTYDLSRDVREYCALVERRPVVAATPERAQAEESRLDPTLLDRAVAARRVHDLRALALADICVPRVTISRVPPGAVVIDTRPGGLFGVWHYPGAEHRDFEELAGGFSALDRRRVYVLVCDLGLRTADLAERMQRAGLEAYSFAGGARELRRYADSASAPA